MDPIAHVGVLWLMSIVGIVGSLGVHEVAEGHPLRSWLVGGWLALWVGPPLVRLWFAGVLGV